MTLKTNFPWTSTKLNLSSYFALWLANLLQESWKKAKNSAHPVKWQKEFFFNFLIIYKRIDGIWSPTESTSLENKKKKYTTTAYVEIIENILKKKPIRLRIPSMNQHSIIWV